MTEKKQLMEGHIPLPCSVCGCHDGSSYDPSRLKLDNKTISYTCAECMKKKQTETPKSETPITKLPDGSGCFIATVMSKEEAMKLPIKERPLCFRLSSEIYHAVFESIGQASMCWNPIPSKEIFSPEEAEEIAVKLCFKIAEELESTQQRLKEMTDVARELCTYGIPVTTSNAKTRWMKAHDKLKELARLAKLEESK